MGNINITTDDEVNHLEVVGMSAAAAIKGKEDDMAEVVSKHYDAAIDNKKENDNDDQ